MADRIYLDHAATTPVLPEARAAMAEAMARWANPSSPHAEGRAAKAALEDARGRIKGALGWAHELIFTSGATEAATLALGRAKLTARAVSAIEHDSVRRAAPDSQLIPVDADGIVDLDTITERTLLAIQTVNSETGVIQPLDQIAAAIRSKGGLWLADAAQSAGKIPLPDADLIVVSAHKLGGPPGIGALLVKDLAVLAPIGGQEKGYRGGTENGPAAIGFAVALEARGSRDSLTRLRDRLDEGARRIGGTIVAEHSPRLLEIASYRLPGLAAAAQLIELDMAGIAVSAGSACSSGTLKPSQVLTAMGWAEEQAREVIRVSIAPQTTMAEVERFLQIWSDLAERRRAA
ncbi:MAG TPA: cysteine desulfurase family protein [Sphingomonas sp.]|uniref:cysteine desulfurase family protein n=1 Tax=Sphingomonas sp. TaxID=28214 RepID=UPI002CD21382|nr:cysteine desulfurase family protein [Sphingomonas sp.]HMI20083.1 cysteine desulfurase family protein [Sphingomonas sp.]